MADTDIRGRSISARTTRGLVWAVFGASVLAMIGMLIFGVGSIVGPLLESSITTQLVTEQPLPTEASTGTATLMDGAYETASVTVTDVTTATLVVNTVGRSVGLLTQLAVAGALALLCWSLATARPFRRSLSVTVTTAGAIVLIGGIISAGLSVFSSWFIAEQLNSANDGLDGFWPMSAAVDPTFIVLGIGLMCVGLAFDVAERLQRDTMGLV
ncbi:MAG: hypothetical protein ACOH1T_12425 [Microbacteriaceae bacterium]